MVVYSNWHQDEEYLSDHDVDLTMLIKNYGPCTLKPRTDYFLALCESIISQQLATKAAAAIYQRFVNNFLGNPTPALIAATPAEHLRNLGLSNNKCIYIFDLADSVITERIMLDRFTAMPDSEIINQLIQVKGIGKWTAQIFLIFALNRPDVFPADDLGLKKAIQNLYNLDSLPTKTAAEKIAKAWQPYRTMASWYLWRSLENK